MKKSLLALAALTAFTGAASAQSNVTMYGRVDLSVNKGVGTAKQGLSNGSGSRFGLRGSEDLGGGMAAIFNVEMRFDADTGSWQNNCITPTGATAAPAGACGVANRFWGARSLVGLKGGFGQLTLGREYSTAFLGSQLANDPWGWDTVVSGTPGTGLNAALTGGGIARVRNDSAATYNVSMSGFSFGAQIAQGTDAINSFQKKPYNFSVGYAAGPVTVNFGYEKTGLVAAAAGQWTTLGGTFNLGMVKLGASVGTGTTTANAKNQSMMLTAVGVLGQGELRGSVGQLTTDPAGAVGKTDAAKGFALGYHYALSKRTTLYTDYVRNTAVATEKNGYDFGIKHNF
jgi:predicted porin